MKSVRVFVSSGSSTCTVAESSFVGLDLRLCHLLALLDVLECHLTPP